MGLIVLFTSFRSVRYKTLNYGCGILRTDLVFKSMNLTFNQSELYTNCLLCSDSHSNLELREIEPGAERSRGVIYFNSSTERVTHYTMAGKWQQVVDPDALVI